MNKERQFEFIRTLAAVGIALLAAFCVIALISDKPMEVLKVFIFGPLQSKRYIGNVIEMVIPLIFAGLATSILFQASLFNLGAEGLFYITGLIASAVVLNMTSGVFSHPAIAIIVAAVFGALLGVIPGIMKAKWGASELVTSLMFNSIFYGVGLYFLNYYLRDPNATEIVSMKFPESVRLTKILAGTRIHSGLIIALITVAVIHVFLYRTKWGYDLRMTGLNRNFAEYTGINTVWVIIYAHLIAGFIAGLGGSVEVLGMYTRFRWAALPGLGFDGALVAMLAKNKPINVIFAALFLAYIRIGADLMARLTDVPSEMVAIMQAIIILLISAERFLFYWRQKMLLKEATA